MRNVQHVDDPILDWRYVPNTEFQRGAITYAYNASGFRDVDHLMEKPAGTTRIVVVGDSVAEGHGVEWGSVFSSVVQSRLGDRFEVINIAAGGINTPQEVHLFEQEGLRYAPDLVILNFVLNDADIGSKLDHKQRRVADDDSRLGFLNIPIEPRLKRLLISSALVYFVTHRSRDLVARLRGEEETNHFVRLWRNDENRRKVTTGLDRLQDLQREGRFEVLLIIWPLLTDYSSYEFGFVHEWIEEQAESRGFETLDLLPLYSRVSYRDLQLNADDNVHPNALGHQIGGDAFLAWYRNR